MVLVIARQEAGPCEGMPTQGLHSLRMLKGDLENNSGQLRNLMGKQAQ
jgi:hypothetical protein